MTERAWRNETKSYPPKTLKVNERNVVTQDILLVEPLSGGGACKCQAHPDRARCRRCRLLAQVHLLD